ncbi:MAG: SUMF1/EgtB/PvdO family nonheme iron enzyme [Flavobacteriales bacterium]|nr:SUMF1/EgtB/PvdO family nonheme iron enzyme [Flavobacteriales bacterium]
MKIAGRTPQLLLFFGAILLLSSCGKERSGATGWAYNDPNNGGFEKAPFVEQETGPGLVLIEGGTFTMGRVEDDVNFAWDNQPRRVTVSSFYMDETEVTNMFWLEYLYWLDRIYGDSYPEIVNKALPDTLVWRSKLAYNEPYVEYYLRHPAYRDYPVVGVNWLQANDFCAWRTDRVNELILIREGLLLHSPTSQVDEDHFTTDSYLANQYEGEKAADGIEDLNPTGTGYRNVKMEDGILLPRYRLPTEAEWEYAALGLIGNSYQELVTERKYYPWNGHYVRNDNSGGRFYGQLNANFVRGRGDYMGVAGALNDNGDITTPVYQYAPNDYGLYNMAGNVSEWVLDVYRPLSPEDKNEFRPYRGNVFQTKVLNSEGGVEDKYDYVVYDVDGVAYFLKEYQDRAKGRMTDTDMNLIDNLMQYAEQAKEDLKNRQQDQAMQRIQDGMDLILSSDATIAPDLRDGIADYVVSTPGDLRYREVTIEENIDRRNYQVSRNIDYQDGDFQSSIYYYDTGKESDENRMYEWGSTTLINNRARVYKGGSWKDRAYWTIPGTRRFLDERRSTDDIGFRCAMDRVGSPVGFSQE